MLALKHAGVDRLSCVQNETVVTDAVRGETNNHYVPILKRHDVPILYNFEPSDMKWVEYVPKAKLRTLQRLFPDGLLVPDYFLGKNVVHLPTAKCHVYTTTTGAMKNAFGGLLGKNRYRAHASIHETLVDLLALQKEIHPGLFAIMDATTAGDGPGPRTLRPVVKGFMLASADQVAIDAVAARMMGFDPLQIGYIRGAHAARPCLCARQRACITTTTAGRCSTDRVSNVGSPKRLGAGCSRNTSVPRYHQ